MYIVAFFQINYIGNEKYKGNDLIEILRKDTQKTLFHYGAGYLPTHELLTILLFPENNKDITTMVTTSLLKTFDGNLIDLFAATIHELTQVEGIGFVEACQIKATFELTKRISSYRKELHPQITSTDEVVHLLAPHMMYLKQEEFRVLLLDSKRKLIRHYQVSLGSLNASIVYPREVFRPAIKHAATFIILVHNHPSGDPEPSEEDILLTQGLCMCGRILGIEVVDHIIIGFSEHVSLKDRRLIPIQ